ncbi:MAG: flavodoxin [Chloroflexi bacterium]|nr:flavodoxin [Chloroflexota bacterium]
MTSAILVGYATRYGSTREVAEAVAEELRGCGLAVDLKPVREVQTLESYRAVVLGAPLLMFHLHKDALRFLKQNRKALTERPVALFALGPVSAPYNEGEWQGSRAQLDRDLASLPWLAPVSHVVFGGKFDPALLPFPVNKLAGKAPATDLRDWEAIRTWASSLAEKI